MAAKDPATRKSIAEKAIYERLSRMTAAERVAATEPARAERMRQLEDEVDPRRELDEAERARRVTYLLRSRMAEISLLGVKAREEKRAARLQAEAEAELDAMLSAEAGAR